MNRSQYEIDFGYIPRHFRDSVNPNYGIKPLQMDLDSHGFRFMIQTHDAFTAQFSLHHPRWREAARNLLTVMERPVIIHGREVSVRTEAELTFRWGHSHSVEWKSRNIDDLDRLVQEARDKAFAGH